MMITKPSLKGDRIQSFTHLHAWQQAHVFVLQIYKCTGEFPQQETFGLTSQMRRAAVSITSNIAEGFRKRTLKEKRQFFTTSMASLTEVQNQLLIGKDLSYIASKDFTAIANQSVRVSKLIQGLIRGLSKL